MFIRTNCTAVRAGLSNQRLIFRGFCGFSAIRQNHHLSRPKAAMLSGFAADQLLNREQIFTQLGGETS
jgi:hypothetical protein